MSIIKHSWYIYLRHVRVWVTQPANVVATVAMSVLFFVFFAAPFSSITQLPGFPTDNYSSFLTGVMLVQMVIFSGADAGFSMLTDILSGYFDKLLLAPINRFAILLSSLLMAATRVLVQVVVVLIMAFIFGVSFKTGIVGLLAIAVFTMVFGMTWSCLGLIIAIKTKSTSLTQSLWLVFMPLAFVTTAFMPLELLSGWFKVAVKINPITYVVESLRAMIITGWDWSTIVPGLWILGILTVTLMGLTTYFYRRETA